MPKRHFTYNVSVSFEMQFTFSESEVEQSDNAGDGAMVPTGTALEALGKEIEQCLGERFGGVDKMEAWADIDDFLGVDED